MRVIWFSIAQSCPLFLRATDWKAWTHQACGVLPTYSALTEINVPVEDSEPTTPWHMAPSSPAFVTEGGGFLWASGPLIMSLWEVEPDVSDRALLSGWASARHETRINAGGRPSALPARGYA